MTEKEVDELISSLRELVSSYDRYVIRYGSENRLGLFEYLLDDGTLIRTYSGLTAKEALKYYLLNCGYTFVGVGVFHKAL